MATSTRFVSRTVYHFKGGLFIHFHQSHLQKVLLFDFTTPALQAAGARKSKWHFARRNKSLVNYKHNIRFTSIFFSLVQLKIFLKDIFTIIYNLGSVVVV